VEAVGVAVQVRAAHPARRRTAAAANRPHLGLGHADGPGELGQIPAENPLGQSGQGRVQQVEIGDQLPVRRGFQEGRPAQAAAEIGGGVELGGGGGENRTRLGPAVGGGGKIVVRQ
jgi:hypothetical protein